MIFEIIEILKDINIAQLIATGVMLWFFYSRLDKKIDSVESKLNERINKLEENLNKISEKIEDIYQRLNRLEIKIEDIYQRLNRLEIKIEKLEDRFDKLIDRVDDIDRRLSRVEGMLATQIQFFYKNSVQNKQIDSKEE